MNINASKVSVEKPLEGALLCCTSILPEDRAELAQYAQEMGAKHTLDLTSDVTHLLVGNTDSKKYQYVAKEREDVKVLLPEWVHAVRKRWMADEAIDLNALDAQYRCPTLYGLKICITGFEDLDFRNELANNIAKNGGQYTGDLTKDVTHLIAFIPQGKKYDYAGTWGIKIVSLKWYKDTLDRGMQLDESLYDPIIVPELQGRGAWNRLPSGTTRLGKRTRDEKPAQETARKLRRAASARFGSQQHDMWNEIVGPPSADSNVGGQKLRPTRSASNIKADTVPNPTSDSGEAQPADSTRDTQIHTFNEDSHPKGFLANKYFAQKGFDTTRKERLFGALTGYGAIVYESVTAMLSDSSLGDQDRFLVVPHEIQHRQLVMVQNGLRGTTIVTELWLEYCMTVKAFVPPGTYALAGPVCPTDIPGSAKLIVNASGFHQVQTMHIAKIVKKIGATYCENFTQQTSVLVCNSSNLNEQKIAHALSWKVPVVTEKWLWKLLATNRIPSFESFSVEESAHKSRSSDVEVKKPLHKEQVDSREEPAAGDRDESDAEDSFVEAAKAIQTREARSDREGRQNNLDRSRPGKLGGPQQQPSRARDSPLPLQEVSTNVMSKGPRSEKKKLFQQFDGNGYDHAETVEAVAGIGENTRTLSGVHAAIDTFEDDGMPLVGDNDPLLAINRSPTLTAAQGPQNLDKTLLKEFFEIKAAAEARKTLASSNESKSKKNKLMGRALSNLSNSSRKSIEDIGGRERQPLSRASSINSLNTDGLGVPLSNLSRIPSDLYACNNKNTKSMQRQPGPSLAGNARAHFTRAMTDSALDGAPFSLSNVPGKAESSFHAALATLSTSQLPHPPSPTQQDQLTYADTDEAAKLKAHLAEKRRARARLGQHEADPGPEISREELARRKAELAREESDEQRQAKWRAEQSEREKMGSLIRDDEKVVGVGRRTRGREKRLSALGGAELGGDHDGFGDGVFEGL